jgi:hypothetical protein
MMRWLLSALIIAVVCGTIAAGSAGQDQDSGLVHSGSVTFIATCGYAASASLSTVAWAPHLLNQSDWLLPTTRARIWSAH